MKSVYKTPRHFRGATPVVRERPGVPLIEFMRTGPFRGPWLFALVFLAQFGHLIEHIAKVVQGHGLLGPSFDSELSHLMFNGTIAVLAAVLMLVHPASPWVYPLAVLSVLHGIEHVYIFNRYLTTGATSGPGLLGRGGALGLIPMERLDLHNAYNGFETILITLGLWHET